MDTTYRPLVSDKREMRLLTVHPGSDSDIVARSVSYACLVDDPKPSYETISYVWRPRQRRLSWRIRPLMLFMICVDGLLWLHSEEQRWSRHEQ